MKDYGDDQIPKHKGKKKDTKKWCKGKVGIIHKPVWQENKKNSIADSISLVYTCTVCNKEIDYYFHIPRWKFANRHEKYEVPKIGSTEPLKLKTDDSSPR